MKNINIIGSGLSGPLLATLIAQNSNLKINMFERSQDLRNSNNFSGRSINLALSKRGINASSISDISSIPRATVIRKLKTLEKKKLINRN